MSGYLKILLETSSDAGRYSVQTFPSSILEFSKILQAGFD